ncbi:hypothetical protein FKM82_026350 [Ascaphus truei]
MTGRLLPDRMRFSAQFFKGRHHIALPAAEGLTFKLHTASAASQPFFSGIFRAATRTLADGRPAAQHRGHSKALQYRFCSCKNCVYQR